MKQITKMSKESLALVFLLIMGWSFPTYAGLWFTIPPIEKSIIEMGTYSKSGLIPQNIKVLIWNIYKGKKESFERDYSYLSGDSDLILIQEVLTSNKIKILLEDGPLHGFKMATSFVYKKSKLKTGVAIGSKVAPSFFDFKRSKGRELIGHTPKVVAIAKFDIEGTEKKLLVVNIHALNSVSSKSHAKQLWATEGIIREHEGPVLFAGDFNTWTKKKTKTLKSYMQLLGLQEVIFDNGNERMKAPITGRILDYVFVREISIIHAHVWGELDGSDHKALSLTLSIKDDNNFSKIDSGGGKQ